MNRLYLLKLDVNSLNTPKLNYVRDLEKLRIQYLIHTSTTI